MERSLACGKPQWQRKGHSPVTGPIRIMPADNDLKKVLAALINQAELEISECDTLLSDNGIASA